MIFYKSKKLEFKKTLDTLSSFNENDCVWGFMLRHNGKLIGQRNFFNTSDMFNKLSLIEESKKLNYYEIAFCKKRFQKMRFSMPMAIADNMRDIDFRQDYKDNCFEEIRSNNLVMIESINSYHIPKNSKYSIEQNYIKDVLNSFKEEILDNELYFLQKYGLFENNTFVTLNRRSGFRFFGNFANGNHNIACLKDILESKSLVYNL